MHDQTKALASQHPDPVRQLEQILLLSLSAAACRGQKDHAVIADLTGDRAAHRSGQLDRASLESVAPDGFFHRIDTRRSAHGQTDQDMVGDA